MGRADPARRNARGAGHARAPGQSPLYRLLELFRLAPDEGARHLRARASPALRQPADPLHAGSARGRIRAGAHLARPGARRPGLEPARRRPALRQAPPRRRQRPRARASSPAGPNRRSATKTGCGTSSRKLCRHRAGARRLRRPGRAGLAPRPPGGDLSGHRRPHRGAVQGQPRRRQPRADARKNASASTRSAHRRCSTPTGTSCRPRATA